MVGESRNDLTLEEREAIAGIFTREYYELAYFNGITFVAHLILQLFEKTGILHLLKNRYISCEETIEQLNFTPKAKYALGWMLSFLNQNGFLEAAGNKDGKRYCYNKSDDIELQAFLQKTAELDPKILSSSRLMEYVINEYPNFFSGLKKGFEILFSGDKAIFWNEYFSNDNSGYSVHNSFGALGILKWALERNNVRLLEVGAGTGSASSALIDKLKEKKLLSRISEYILSDISPVFLRIGNRAIMNRVSDDFAYSLKRLDFDKPLPAQGIQENGVDIVYGVNSLHVAKNLVASLQNIYQVIKPDGMLILSECCRANAGRLLSQEIVFNLLDNYVDVDLDEDLRPLPGFLDAAHWRRNLEAAGFKNIYAIFNTDGNYSPSIRNKVDILATVIKAEKEGG